MSDDDVIDLTAKDLETTSEEETGEVTNRPPEAKTIRITELDRLKVENLQLKASVSSLRKEILVRDYTMTAQKIDEELKDIQQEINKFRVYATNKYGIDFNAQQLKVDTGTIVDNPKQ